MSQPPSTEAVRKHYADLAQSYNEGANTACNQAYARLVSEELSGAQAVLEIGAGAHPLAGVLNAPLRVACDLTPEMLQQSESSTVHQIVCDSLATPFTDSSFDAVFSINVIEHVPNPSAFMAETMRLLKPNGILMIITPNGDFSRVLALLERLRLKLPEGPHRFVTAKELRVWAATTGCSVETLMPLLAFPVGPDFFVRAVDALARPLGIGLFILAVLRKQED